MNKLKDRTFYNHFFLLFVGLLWKNDKSVSDILILKVNFFFLGKVVVPRLAAGEGAQGTTCEEYNSLQFPIVKEVIKGPKTAILGKGIWGQIRGVGVDVAIW